MVVCCLVLDGTKQRAGRVGQLGVDAALPEGEAGNERGAAAQRQFDPPLALVQYQAHLPSVAVERLRGATRHEDRQLSARPAQQVLHTRPAGSARPRRAPQLPEQRDVEHLLQDTELQHTVALSHLQGQQVTLQTRQGACSACTFSGETGKRPGRENAVWMRADLR